jgi:hypothetical protein
MSMKFYHGSKSDISEFNVKGGGKHGKGFYFTPDRNEAIHFAKSLYGDGTKGLGFVYEIRLSFSNPFNTMSIAHCKIVSKLAGFDYQEPSFAGGAKERYHHLVSQLKGEGAISSSDDVNDFIKEAGFDCILYDLMGHVIVFDSSQISIEAKEALTR